jgi:hypothetical protein
MRNDHPGGHLLLVRPRRHNYGMYFFENRPICYDFFAERRSRIVLLHVELVLVRRETPQKYVHIFGEDKKIHFGQSWKLYYFVVGNADANFALVVLLLCCVAAALHG